MSIEILSPEVVSLMAAGEVIHRPADVVKELLENALDAGASQIKVDLMQGGLEKIKVTDNGQGISKDFLPLALKAHATSKLKAIDELQNMSTYGFRGEALYAIHSIANFFMSSFPRGEKVGYEVSKFSPHWKIEVKPVAMEHGTVVQVNQLFAPYPVRRKFLKSPRLEWQHCQKIVIAMAIISFDISWTLSHNFQPILRYQKTDSMQKRLEQIFPKSKNSEPWKKRLRTFDKGSIEIFYQTTHSKGIESWWYINNRYVLCSSFKKLLSQYLPIGKACLKISIDHRYLDPNLHPQKLIVGLTFYEGFLASLQDFFSEIFSEQYVNSHLKKDVSIQSDFLGKSLVENSDEKSGSLRERSAAANVYYDKLNAHFSKKKDTEKASLVDNDVFRNQHAFEKPIIDSEQDQSVESPLIFIPLNAHEVLIKFEGDVYHIEITRFCSELLKKRQISQRKLLIPFTVDSSLQSFFLEHGFLFKKNMLISIPKIIDAIKLERQISQISQMTKSQPEWSWLKVLNQGFWTQSGHAYLKKYFKNSSLFWKKLTIETFSKKQEILSEK